jgi:hypothetical protein
MGAIVAKPVSFIPRQKLDADRIEFHTIHL